MSSQVLLRLLPSARCLYDEPIQVKVTGLRSRQVVTLGAKSVDQKNLTFSSAATYKADEHGEIDLTVDPSLRGSYVGVEPMGLLWSMKTDALHKKFQRTQAQTAHIVKFSVHEEGESRVLAEATNERLLIGDGVTRMGVKLKHVRGALFIPPGPGPFPAALDLYTWGGGISERRPSLLASRGFVVLTVALYGHEDLPKNINKIELEYFEEAVEFLRKQPQVGSKGIGVLSLSKSGDLALSIASYLPGVEATVWINGCSANTAIPLYYKNKQLLAPLQFDPKNLQVTESGIFSGKSCVYDPLAEEHKDSLIPVEQAKGQFLLVASEDDLNWNSMAYMGQIVDRLRCHGKANFECVSYPKAGHFLEPPYGPYCTSSIHGLVRKPFLWGGEARAHAAAEVHLWKKIQDFFRSTLTCEATQAKL